MPYLTIETRQWKIVKQEPFSEYALTFKNILMGEQRFISMTDALRFARQTVREWE